MVIQLTDITLVLPEARYLTPCMSHPCHLSMSNVNELKMEWNVQGTEILVGYATSSNVELSW